MSTNHQAAPVTRSLFTPGMLVLFGFAATGFGLGVYRFVFGLGAATNLSNPYPWGIWIGIDVATGVALAAGGFTTAALAHIFHAHQYESVVRPALLTAVLGYTFVVLGLLVDLGRYYNIWHPMLPMMWQGNSVLFEVAMCVMVYLNVLYLEFLPLVCERFIGNVRLPGPLSRLNGLIDGTLRFANRALSKVMSVFIIAGVVLSCMHQSSLGALMLIARYKMNPLWYTPILPLLFLLSAVTVGLAMVIFESSLSARALKRKQETAVLGSLSRFLVLFLGIYFAAKVSDMLIRESYSHLLDGGAAPYLFAIELGLGVFVPLVMLATERVRRSPLLLFSASALVVGGVALNRINVFLTAYRPPYATTPYFPSASEILITLGFVAGLVLLYRVAITVLPVLPRESEEAEHEASAAPEAQRAKWAAGPSHSYFLLLALACGLLLNVTAAAQDAMPKTDTGGDCSTCHSTENPSKADLYPHLCKRAAPPSGKLAETTAAPDFFILKELTDLYVPVVFPHRLHASMEAMGDGCEVCHHHTEKGKIVACKECHSGASNPDNLRQPGLKGAYHRQCLSCHREWSHDTDCVFCHAKRVPGDIVDVKPDPSDFVGTLHPNVAVPEKHVYPTPNEEEGTLVTFHHKDHVELFGRRCVDCHRKENCSHCHDTSTPRKHVKEDPHQDCTKCHDVSDQCGRCHQKSESPGFDHFRRTGFTLMRYHAQVACQKCHAETKGYKGLPRDCQGCHRVDWTPKGFDHAKTGLTLDDKHSDSDCQACHTDGLGKPARCDSCHDDKRKFPDKAPGTVAAGAQLPGMPAATPAAPPKSQ